MRTAYIDGPFYYGRDAAEFGDFMMGHEAKAPGTVMRSLERIYAQGDWLIRLAKKIRSSDYSRTDMKRLISDFRRFAKEYVLFGISLAGYNIQLPVEKHLRKVLIKRGIDEGELGLLTFPLKENFAALEAKNLLRIGSVIQDKGEFSDLSRAEQKMLAEHVEEYGWINARGGLADPWTENEIFDRIKEVKGSCAEKLSESEAHRKDEMWRSDALLKRLDLDQKLRAMVAIARELVYFRTYRTDCLNQAVPLIRNLLEAIAKKRSISYEDLLHLRVDEILEEEEVSREEISRRKNGYAEMCLKPGELRFTSDPEEMESWQKEYCEEDGHDSTEIKGTPANKGSVKGIVHIVMTKQDIHKVREGDVLVAPMTTPNMVSAMEKAAAFVTDEGGITCHAAIIAREMKKPCIIGTKNATKILKDGDLVEVDADTGEVKIIRRA
ncbi:hypothetical protein JW826_00870 [Candidatus Woesearchaeota archaeon]|nr:hypothetical protein [Candidatus Woesearchaeota archaeon]